MSELGDRIVGHGPYDASMDVFRGGVLGRVRAADVNALRDELIELRYARTAAAEVHQQHEGRCAECVEYCDCPGEHTCEHGNVPWPCRTAKALGLA